MKKTKIVCTIGPVTESVETLKELLNRGMNVMRLNFSHGDYEEHGTRIKNFRQAMSETGKRAGLLLDTKGPEIRKSCSNLSRLCKRLKSWRYDSCR